MRHVIKRTDQETDFVPAKAVIDGKGYPSGLRGEEIPAEARMLAVVDSYDAMVSNRPYRRALPIEEALSQIRRGAGSQFDAMFVASFEQMIRDRWQFERQREIERNNPDRVKSPLGWGDLDTSGRAAIPTCKAFDLPAP